MKYTLSLRALHWLMALGLIGMIASGLVMGDLPQDYKFTVYGLHKSFGVSLFALALLRLAIRFGSSIPPMPDIIKAMERRAAKSVHALFYLLMFAMPVSGYLMTNGKGYDVAWFGTALPRIVEKSPPLGETAAEAHELLGYLFIAAIALHVLGFLKHAVKDKTNLLRRMW